MVWSLLGRTFALFCNSKGPSALCQQKFMMAPTLKYLCGLRPRSHHSVFVSIRFCCIKASVHTAPFSNKNGEKNLRFCAFTLICPITKTQRKNIRFCVFTLLRFCEAHCWMLERFQKPPFLCVHIDQMRFQKPPFCGYPLLTAFSKTSIFVAFLCGSV